MQITRRTGLSLAVAALGVTALPRFAAAQQGASNSAILSKAAMSSSTRSIMPRWWSRRRVG